jgi:hypothetical protein
MATISEVVDLKTGYANFVELKSAYAESQENADRMAMYRPTKAHRQAFERICRGLYQPNDKKFYLLSGSYGTGKSHLCLMLANFLSRSSGDPQIASFYENYSKLEPDTGKTLKNVRKDGRYLVVICDYHSGKRFEDVLLKEIFDACQAAGLDAGVSTEYDEAQRQLDDWQAKGTKAGIRDFYEDFNKALENLAPGMTVDALRAKLKDFDSDALELFRDVFKVVTGGVDFQAKSGNLIPIVRALVRSNGFKERFKGLAIFFDEFGFTLESASYSKDILQGFMETICKNEPNVFFIGCIHKDFKSYADKFSQDDAAVMSARITQVDLLNEGIEEIIGAIVETKKDSEVWRREVLPRVGVFDQLVPPCKTLNLFPWIEDVNRIRQRVLEDIYGVHPMALACLLKLSSEVGSDARSTFTFFSGQVGGERGSYAEFIERAEIVGSGNKLNLYTVNQLYSFFRKELSQKNPELREKQRSLVNGFYASLDALRKLSEGELLDFNEDEADVRVKVIQAVLVYQLCQVPTNAENILFGLYCLNKAEKKIVDSALTELDKKGVLFFRKQSETYELATSEGGDPYDLVERYEGDPSLHPADTVAALLEEAGGKQDLKYLDASSYNLPFGEDKRCRTLFVRAKDIGDSLWDSISNEWQEYHGRPKDSFEGALVYALCEDEAEIKMAREACASIQNSNIAVAIPHEPQPFTDLLIKVKACRHYLPPNESEKISAQIESRFRDILENTEDGYLPRLKRAFTDIHEGSNGCWFTKDGGVLIDKPQQIHKPADTLCELQFSKRCRIKHPDLNLCHDDKWLTGKNTALKQAVAGLLEAERVQIDNGNPDNHGEKRYLEKVLAKGAGALKKTDKAGNVTFFECETSPDKLSDDFPVLKELCQEISRLNAGEVFPLGIFLEKVGQPPYGAGGTQLILSLAHVIRGYGEHLIPFKDSTKQSEQAINTYEDLLKIVSDVACKTVFEVREITDPQSMLIEKIAETVNAPPLLHGESRTLTSAFEALREWWNELKPVAKVITVYQKDRQSRLNKLKSVLHEIENNADRFDLILKQLPSVYSEGPIGDEITESEANEIGTAFADDVRLLNSGEQLVRTEIAREICKTFAGTGDLVECRKLVVGWYENLNPSQRDPGRYRSEETACLITRLGEPQAEFATTIVVNLPQDYGFGRVSDWSSLHIDEYAAKVRQAKQEIDKAKPDIPSPDVVEGVHEVMEQKSDELKVAVPDGASRLLVTTDGTDPLRSETAKIIEAEVNLKELLGNAPSVQIKIQAVDEEGNASDVKDVKLINKAREYEINIQEDMFGEAEATYKVPNTMDGLVAVLTSIIQYSEKKGLVDKEAANRLADSIKGISRGSGR